MKKSIIHIYLYGMIKREVNGSKTVHISRIQPIVKYTIRLPRKYQKGIVNELVECGLLKKIDRDNYEILQNHCKPPIDSLGEPLW